MDLSTRKVEIGGIASSVNGLWMNQIACNLTDVVDGYESERVQYYTSTLSFDQRFIHRFAVHLMFSTNPPDWLRVYECEMNSRPNLIDDLCPFKKDELSCEYIDVAEDVPGQSARIYVFHFSSSPHRDSGSALMELSSNIRRLACP